MLPLDHLGVLTLADRRRYALDQRARRSAEPPLLATLRAERQFLALSRGLGGRTFGIDPSAPAFAGLGGARFGIPPASTFGVPTSRGFFGVFAAVRPLELHGAGAAILGIDGPFADFLADDEADS